MSQDVRSTEGPPGGDGIPHPGERSGGFGWRRLQVGATIAVLGSLLIPMLIQLSFEPFLLMMGVPFVLGLVVLLRWPRVGAIWLGVSSLAVLLFSAPFLADALAHPEALADFIPLLVFTLSTAVGTVAAIPSFRQGPGPAAPSRPARIIGIAAGATVVAGVIASVAAFAGVENVPAQPGDIRVVTEAVKFNRADIDAPRGTISVHVTNRDDTRHTFTVDELGVDLNLPPNSTQRVTFTAGPGTYRFYCRPHTPGMEGVLVVR